MSDAEIVLLPVKGFEVNKNEVETNNISFRKLQNIGNFNGQLVSLPKPKPFAKADTIGIVDGYFTLQDPVRKQFFFATQIGKDYYTLDNINNKLVKGGSLYYDSAAANPVAYESYEASSVMQTANWVYQNECSCYFTKPGLPLSKFSMAVDNNTAQTVPPTYIDEQGFKCYLSAKYLIATNNRLFLGNCFENSNAFPTRIHWSNLNNPEYWAVSETSEADYFDLGVNSADITGLAYANDVLFIFSKNSIWRSDYESFETKFRTTKLSSIGCPHHYSVIVVDDKIYFIGHNNIYCLDNLTLSTIGDPIWNWFYAHHSHDKDSNIIAQYDLIKNCIVWSFEDIYKGESFGKTNIVYSLSTQTWYTTK